MLYSGIGHWLKHEQHSEGLIFLGRLYVFTIGKIELIRLHPSLMTCMIKIIVGNNYVSQAGILLHGQNGAHKFSEIIPKPLAPSACFHVGNLFIFITLVIGFSFFGLSFLS